MTLKVDDIVRVTALIAPTGLLRRDFGRTLFLTTDTTLPSNERVRVYASQTSLATDFAVGSEPYEAGNIYFQQVPYPKNFMVGRWFDSVEDGLLHGGTAHGTLALFTAIADGSLAIKIDLTPDYATLPTTEYALSGVDLQGAADLDAVATLVETALLTAINGQGFDVATVVYNAVTAQFEIAITADVGTTIVTTGYAYATGAGTDISALLAMTAALASKKGSSTIIETVEDALTGVETLDGSFYFVTGENDTINDTTNSDDISAWIASRVYMYSADSVDLAVLAQNDSVFKRLSILEPPRTFGTWSVTPDYKAVSAAGRLSSVNFNAGGSLITLKFKELPGTIPDSALTETQAGVLDAQAVNFYSERSGVPMYEEGYTFDKDAWIDVRYWLDWFVNAVQVEVFNVLKGIPTKVPQTEAGMSTLKEAITAVCFQGVNNGGIAGGQLSPALTLDVQQSTGNAEFDGELAAGYLVYAAPVATFAQSERAQRKVPPFQVWLKGSGAIHFVDVAIVFEN